MNLHKIFKPVFITSIIFYLHPVIGQDVNKNIIPVELFKLKIEAQSKPQIIDVRTPEEFNINHINGAINIDMQQADYLTTIKNINKEQPVFIYAIQTNRPDVLAKQLQERGYKEVYELKSGIAAWIGAGYTYLSTAKNTVSLNDYHTIISSNKLVLVYIGSTYCGICRKAKLIVDSVKNEYQRSLKTVEIDVQDNPQLIADLKLITAIPFILIYKNGEIILKRSGIVDLKNDLENAVASVK